MRAKKTVTVTKVNTQLHQNQLPEMPLLAMMPAIASGVSAANVVATIEVPRHHQGSERSATKYEVSPRPAVRVIHTPATKAETR